MTMSPTGASELTAEESRVPCVRSPDTTCVTQATLRYDTLTPYRFDSAAPLEFRSQTRTHCDIIPVGMTEHRMLL